MKELAEVCTYLRRIGKDAYALAVRRAWEKLTFLEFMARTVEGEEPELYEAVVKEWEEAIGCYRERLQSGKRSGE